MLFFSIGILLLGASSFYYFIFCLPDQNELKKQQQERDCLLSMKEECQELGMETFEKERGEIGVMTVFNPIFVYSQKLNTCLYAGGSVT